MHTGCLQHKERGPRNGRANAQLGVVFADLRVPRLATPSPISVWLVLGGVLDSPLWVVS